MSNCLSIHQQAAKARGRKLIVGVVAACLGWVTSANAASMSNLFSFDQHVALAGVTQGLGGEANNVFGSTYDVARTSGGTLFKVARGGGSPQVIYQFTENDGYSPRAALIASADGYLYGTTHNSKPTTSKFQSGGGTVFRVLPNGSGFQTLHDFGGATNNPNVDDSVGADFSLLEVGNYLYGVTSRGGANDTGSVFRLSKDGSSFTTLYEFGAAPQISAGVYGTNGDGAKPSAALVLGSDGLLYGVTRYGGANEVTSGTTVLSGAGTIYSLAQDGSGFTLNYSFPALQTAPTAPAVATNATGVNPAGPLLQTANGVFVGTAVSGGDPGNSVAGFGTLYQLTVSGNAVVALHSFNNTDGAAPAGALALVGGKVYGTTTSGLSTASPALTYGSLFELTLGAPATLVNLYGHAFGTGIGVTGGVMADTDGDLYGVTTNGGACTALNGSGYGTVYRYSLTTNGSASNYSNCIQPSSSGGGGAMHSGLLALLAALAMLGWAQRRMA